MNRVSILSIVASAALLLYILEMVRRRRLREEYSILWLSGSLVILVLSVKQEWLHRISRAVGIAYPTSFLFLVGILFILLILIHFSIAISKLHQANKRMAQEIALMTHESESREKIKAQPPRRRPRRHRRPELRHAGGTESSGRGAGPHRPWQPRALLHRLGRPAGRAVVRPDLDERRGGCPPRVV